MANILVRILLTIVLIGVLWMASLGIEFLINAPSTPLVVLGFCSLVISVVLTGLLIALIWRSVFEPIKEKTKRWIEE